MGTSGRDTPPDDPRHENMTKIVEAGDTGARHRARPARLRPREPGEIDTLDLNQLVRDTLKLLEKQLQAIQVRHRAVNRRSPGASGRRPASAGLRHIILNALDAMKAGAC